MSVWINLHRDGFKWDLGLTEVDKSLKQNYSGLPPSEACFADITADFSPCVAAVWLSEGRSLRLQLFNFVHGWEHLQGNPLDLSEQLEIGHSVRCKEEELYLWRHCSTRALHRRYDLDTKLYFLICRKPVVFENPYSNSKFSAVVTSLMHFFNLVLHNMTLLGTLTHFCLQFNKSHFPLFTGVILQERKKYIVLITPECLLGEGES